MIVVKSAINFGPVIMAIDMCPKFEFIGQSMISVHTFNELLIDCSVNPLIMDFVIEQSNMIFDSVGYVENGCDYIPVTDLLLIMAFDGD